MWTDSVSGIEKKYKKHFGQHPTSSTTVGTEKAKYIVVTIEKVKSKQAYGLQHVCLME